MVTGKLRYRWQAFRVVASAILRSQWPRAGPTSPVWHAQLAASALFVLGVYLRSAAVKPMKASGAELALDEVTSQLVEADKIPEDFRDFVKQTGHFKSDRPAT